MWIGITSGVMVFAGIAVGLIAYFSPLGQIFRPKREDLLTHTVREGSLQIQVTERGTLESANNIEVICKVKAGSRGTFASTIKWVIDDGTPVEKGAPIMDLDDSALKDQEQSQFILTSRAQAAWIKAKEDLTIQMKANETDIAAKFAALKVAELDLERFLGVRHEPILDPLGSLMGAPFTLVERGEYRMKLDDVSSRLKLAESDLEAYRDRSSWADRSVKLGFLTPSQAKVERSKLEGANDNLGKLQAEKYALENFTRVRELTNLSSLVDVAKAAYEQSVLQAHAKSIQLEAEVYTSRSVYDQEQEKLSEIQTQIQACKITAPQSGMVVYYKDPSSSYRGSSSSQGLIAQGEQVREGQKLMRIPDLTRMQVNAKIHEALVSKIKGDDRRPTGNFEMLRAGFLTIPSAFGRISSQSDFALNVLREHTRDVEYYIAEEGQEVTVRVDAFPERQFKGRVKTVAQVASTTDFFSSDVKVYPTIVRIIDTDVYGLKPDMSAEVIIHVDNSLQNVLTVPIQSVVGGAELGPKRKIFVLENGILTVELAREVPEAMKPRTIAIGAQAA